MNRQSHCILVMKTVCLLSVSNNLTETTSTLEAIIIQQSLMTTADVSNIHFSIEVVACNKILS